MYMPVCYCCGMFKTTEIDQKEFKLFQYLAF